MTTSFSPIDMDRLCVDLLEVRPEMQDTGESAQGPERVQKIRSLTCFTATNGVTVARMLRWTA